MARKVPVGTQRLKHPAGRALTPTEIHATGFRSSRQFNPDQGTLDLGVAHAPPEAAHSHPLTKWEDMHPDRRAAVESHLSEHYGVTMRNAIHNHGVLIDRSVMESGGQGQHFYRGGGDDVADHIGKQQIHHAALHHDLPVHVVAAMRATLSPRSNVHDEVMNLHHVINHVKSNPNHTGAVPGAIGMNGPRNSAKAVAVLRAHQQGIHPLDATDPRNPKKKLIDPASNPKVLSYMQGYTHPDHPATRTAVDTHAVGGMAPHLPKTAPRQPTGKLDKKGKPFTTPVGKGHPSWTPNQEDALGPAGAYEFFDYAQRQAAHKRGLTSTEGQSMAWHVERARGGGQQPGTGNARARGGKGQPKQLGLGL